MNRRLESNEALPEAVLAADMDLIPDKIALRAFSLWMDSQLEILVARWISSAAPGASGRRVLQQGVAKT